MDVKNVWLGRYVNNIGASTKYCNKLCNNPVIAGASGYTISPLLYSKKEFDKSQEILEFLKVLVDIRVLVPSSSFNASTNN